MNRFFILALSIFCLFGLFQRTQAQGYVAAETYTAIATGEGENDIQFGSKVAIDGNLAVVTDVGNALHSARLRTYVRTAGVWTPAPRLNISGTNARVALGNNTLFVLSDSTTGSVVRIYRWSVDRWVSEYSVSTSDRCDSAAADGLIVVYGCANPNNNNTAGLLRVLRSNGSGTWSVQTLFSQSPQDGAGMGHSVAIAAGAIVAGAPFEDVARIDNGQVRANAGAAYVFELTGNVWTQVARLVQTDAELAAQNQFGFAVAISGADPSTPDRMLVASSNAQTSLIGRVRSYTRTSGVWTPRSVIVAATPNFFDNYGCAVSLDGDWAAVGMCDSGPNNIRAGAVQIVRFSSNFLAVVSTTERTDPFGQQNERLGSSLGIDRDGPTVIVGSPKADLYDNRDQGVVLIGRGGADPVPSLVRTLDLGRGLNNASTGTVALDGDTMVLGAPGQGFGALTGQGAIYVYTRNPSGSYGMPQRIIAPDGAAQDYFGATLALRGDSLLVGVYERDVQGLGQAGMVYAFRRVGGVWNLEAQLLAPVPVANAGFGISLAFDGVTAIVGGVTDTWVFERAAAGSWSQSQMIAHRGIKTVLQGELLLLGDFSANLGGTNVGQVSTYARSGGIWQLQSVLTGSISEQRFGRDVALGQDLLAISSSGSNQPVRIFRRSGTTWLPESTLTASELTTGCSAVAVLNGVVAIGCTVQPSPGAISAVYLFDKQNGSWGQRQKLSQLRADSGFGNDLVFHPDGSLFITAQGDDLNYFNEGSNTRFKPPVDVFLKNGFE